MQTNIGGQDGSRRPNLRIAHRRSPSELTPLMMEQYALQQQIELLQAQQAILQNQQASISMGPPANQNPISYAALASQGSSHRRGQSMSQSHPGPPPAPSSGASGFTEVTHQRRGSQSGHNRRHSLALPEAKRAAEKAQAIKQNPTFAFPPPAETPVETNNNDTNDAKDSKRLSSPVRRGPAHIRSQSTSFGRVGTTSPQKTSGFQFPNAQQQSGGAAADSSLRRASSGHNRQSSRSFDNNWRSLVPAPIESQQLFTPGHRARNSMSSSISSLQSFGQPLAYPGTLPSLQMLPQMNGLLATQMSQQQLQGSGLQQRKSLFSPYLPQASLPALLSDGRLVAGTLRVNKKNRSDAYVSTDLLDEDIFICGSKDRNRALEGDYVAVELLDVDEVWTAKREKEDKKKRKDNSGIIGPGLRRQGSIRDRPEAKKKDDVEVEGQGLLLVDEEEVNDEQKPMYAGHIVAVIERTPGQMFSGTLGLLRPSSAATKEKQDAERRDREGQQSSSYAKQPERPKIVWFKPTDKRVPLIAIPTEQAPRDFIDNHENYKNRLFVACIKRWPITSLHPFGTLMEELGTIGDVEIETEALLRDNSFMSEDFSSAVLDAVTQVDTKIDVEMEGRKDFRGERAFVIKTACPGYDSHAFHIRQTEDGYEVGVHVSDANHFIKPGYVLDREAKKRGSSVMLVNRTVPLLPSSLTHEVGALSVGKDKRAISIVFKISESFELEDSWVGKSIVHPTTLLEEIDLDAAKSDHDESRTDNRVADLDSLRKVAESLRSLRYPGMHSKTNSLPMLDALDDEMLGSLPAYPTKQPSTSRLINDELLIRANITISELLLSKLPTAAILRKQGAPSAKKVDQFNLRAKRLGMSSTSSSFDHMLKAISSMEDTAVREALDIYLTKACSRPRYVIAGTVESGDLSHWSLGAASYVHFTNPYSRYSSLISHRQLAVALEDGTWSDDLETLNKVVDLCNTKRDSAKNAQEQSIHLTLCALISKSTTTHTDIERNALVINVMDSSFDVLLPEFGVEKRVHLDQLPLVKAEFNPVTRKLELFWLSPADALAWQPGETSKSPKQKASPTGSASSADVLLPTQSSDTQHPEITSDTTDPETQLLSKLFEKTGITSQTTIRQENGILVQEITDLSRVLVSLEADCLLKSPPLLLVRPIQPSIYEN